MRIRVLKPFVFSRLPAGEKLAIERTFTVGEHEIDDETAAHPYIRDHLADGRIESPGQAMLRLEKHATHTKQAADDAALISAQAQAAFARLTAAGPGAKATAKEIEDQLNTPSNLLRGSAGTAVAPVSADDTGKAADESSAKQVDDEPPKKAADEAAKAPAAEATLKLKTGTK